MANIDVLSAKGEKINAITLDEKIFNGKVNKPLLQQSVVNFLDNQRKGTAATKTQGETRGGGKKPWKQKGTGRARAGSIRSPLWRGGGTVFGPHPRDYSYLLPKKIRAAALASALNAKLNDKEFIVIEDLKLEKPKTKEFEKLLGSLKIKNGTSALFISAKLEKGVVLSGRNIKGVSFKSASDVHAYDILKNNKVIIAKDAIAILTERAHV